MIVDAPRYVPDLVSHRDLQIPTVKEEIFHYTSPYSALPSAYPNDLTVNLMELPYNRRCENTFQMICLPDSKCNYSHKSQEVLNLLVTEERY
jgi:hypothetical protein